MKLPTQLITNQDKLKYLSRVFELLRLEHNVKGKAFREGEMSEKDFRDYQNGEFDSKMKKIFFEMNKVKEIEKITTINPFQDGDNPKLQWEKDGKTDTRWDKYIDLKTL